MCDSQPGTQHIKTAYTHKRGLPWQQWDGSGAGETAQQHLELSMLKVV